MTIHSHPYLGFWGKSRLGDAGLTTHPAAFHMLDVAAVARAWLLATCPFVPGLGAWHEDYLPALLVLVALHDIGKFSRPFQAKIPELWPASLGAYEVRPQPRHDVAGYALLRQPALREALAPLLPELGGVERASVWRAVCGHHGRPPSEEAIDTRTYCAASKAAALAFTQDLLDLLEPQPLLVAFEDVAAFSWWLAGLTVLSDWIGSAEAWFSYPVEAQSLDEYWPQACAKAEKAVMQAGSLPIPPAQAMDFSALIGSCTPSPLQEYVAQMPLPAGPLLIMIEDQTGSGKTEAALMLAHRLMLAHGAGGLFMALPTMATANALYERLSTIYRALFVEGSKPSLVLAHGKRHLNDHFSAALLHDSTPPGTVSDDADETASAQCAAWLADDRRRSFLAACGVGTIDQAVLAVLPSRHAPLRLFGLSQHVLIIDEAHAYNEYVTAELQRLIQFQAKQGGSTIILSATLPCQTRQALLHAFGNKNMCQKNGYPLVTVANASTLAEHDVASRQGLARNVQISRLDNAEQALAKVVEVAARGAAIGWVRNTVDDAIAAHQALRAKGIDATLFHARFAMGDRLATEAQVQARFGKSSIPAQRAHVLVGTQVMEQSLDLDFDLLISDLAPVDLLLQRVGRLWRHEREGRVEPVPRFFVLAPEPVEQPAPDWLKDFRGTAAVYDDPALLWRSARALFSKPNLALPADVRGLVEDVYAPEALVPSGLAPASDKAEGRGFAARNTARQNLLVWGDGYSQVGGAWMSEVATPTRLTDPSLSYRLAVWENGSLRPLYTGDKAWAMSEVTLPKRRADRVPEESGARRVALAALKATWNRWEQESPVLILTPTDEGGEGEVVDQSGRVQRVSYSRDQGCVFSKK